MQCPDRHAKGGSKGKFKSGKGAFGKTGGWSKGKGKSSKGKGKAYFLDLACILSAHWDASSVHGRAPTRAIIDTGASKNAIGADCFYDLVNAGGFNYEVCLEDLPTFRFGNGYRDQAVSRADLTGTALGSISFYVLGGLAKGTPPLIGARTLRGKNAMLSYSDGCFKYYEPNATGHRSVQMQALTSGHITIDLSEAASDHQLHWQLAQDGVPRNESCGCSELKEVGQQSTMSERCINMFTIDHACHVVDEDGFGKTCYDHGFGLHGIVDGQSPRASLSDRSQHLQQLASRLEALRNSVLLCDGRARASSCGRHPPTGFSMLQQAQAGQDEN